MTTTTEQTLNASIARAFIAAWNARDISAFEALLHPAFQWHIAVTEPGVAQMRSLKSDLLKGRNLPWDKAIYDKAETVAIFAGIFARTGEFSIAPHSFTAQDDRVVVELTGAALNPLNGRRYDNLYCYVFRIQDGRIVLFREYQDTLLLFDAWVAP